jgi:hypothetical protein
MESGAVMRDYTWQWEVPFDGQAWEPIGETGPQRVYWTLAAPVAPVFVGLFHSPASPVEFPALFDVVLATRASGWAARHAPIPARSRRSSLKPSPATHL